MMPISGVNTGAVQPMTAAEKGLGASKVQKAEAEEAQGRRVQPVTDEYIRSEPQEPSGRYWMGRDGDGQPKIYFDGPTTDAPEGPEKAANTEKPEPERSGENEGKCACNTDKVDREIEQLKKKQQELEQRLNAETDGAKRKDLERQLAQVERELKQKDNDTYRKQHAAFTQLS